MLLRILTLSSLCVALAASSALGQYSTATSPLHGGRGYGGSAFGGGAFGHTASAFPGGGNPGNLSLVIAQTQDGHEGVTDLLDQLRRLQDQQVRNEVRFHNLQDSFYERNGVNFGFNIKGGGNVIGLDPTGQPTADGNIQFRQGSADNAVPAFGGRDPASDATLGFGVIGDNVDLFFNFFANQGNNRSLVTQAPSVTIPNGGQGFISDTSQTPFVTSVIPVVGAGVGHHFPAFTGPRAPAISPLQQRMQRMRYEEIHKLSKPQPQQAASKPQPILGGGGGSAGDNSSADRGDLSVADIRRQQASETSSEDAELASWLERARGAEAAGKANVAKIYYKMAARRATGEVKQQVIDKLRELSGQQ